MAHGQIAVIGSGYVGLTTGACLARLGHDTVCADIDPARVASLAAGRVPILEAGLPELVRAGLAAGRLSFVVGAATAAVGAGFVFLCLPTPESADGQPDLTAVDEVVREIGPLLPTGAVLVTKSTVPVGTTQRIAALLDRPDVRVVSNPEFLQEGSAVRDFLHPSRIVVGSADRVAARQVAELYSGLDAPLLITSAESAELIKYSANAFLAMKLAFINSVAALAETVGADVDEVAQGLGLDDRIGPRFLNAGPGWGGSCFPKDLKALASTAAAHGIDFPLLDAAIVANEQAKDRVADKVRAAAGGWLDATPVAIWGLTFKAGTDDLRCSPALAVADRLAAEGAVLTAFDPAVAVALPGIRSAADPYAAAADAAVIVVLTEWSVFAEVDFERLAGTTAARVIVDARNVLDPVRAAVSGFTVVSLGRPAINSVDLIPS